MKIGDVKSEQTVADGIEIPPNAFGVSVVHVEHFSKRLFRFRITRPASFRFRSGEFVMIGLPGMEKPVYRAFSMASPSWDEEIELFSIKVPDGPLTKHLQNIRIGDTILLRKKPTGTLVLDALLPGKRLFLISTGTGIAPFASLIRDPDVYENFDQVILTHTCREAKELQYGEDIVVRARNCPLVGEEARNKLVHFGSTTREESAHRGRITHLIKDGSFFSELAIDGFDPKHDRVMICGSIAMLADIRELLQATGFNEGSNSRPGDFVIERAFVD